MTDRLDADLVERYGGLVRQIATDMKRRYRLAIELDELMASGLEGLVQARQAYDAERGASFSSFAYYRIRGAILDNCRRLGAMRRQYQTRAYFEEAANEVLAEVAEIEPATDDRAAATLWIGGAFDSMAAAYELSLADIRETRRAEANPERRAVTTEMKQRLHEHLAVLTDEEREVLDAYYFRHERMVSIASRFGVSKSWVSRVHTRALKKLRPLVAGEPTSEE